MTNPSTEFLTTECPNGHRVRGDVGWLHREVACPLCHAEFIFSRPTEAAAEVKTVATPPPVEQRSLSDTGVMRIIDAFGKPVLPTGDGRTRQCKQCGAEFPSDIGVCYGCNVELEPAEPDLPFSPKDENEIDFQPLDSFPFVDVAIRKVMRPRREIVILDATDDHGAVMKRVQDSKHGYYPVCNGSLDDCIGGVSLEQVVFVSPTNFSLRQLVSEIPMYLESELASEVLGKMASSKLSFGLIVDEYDTVIGMVAMKDITIKLLATLPKH